MKKLFTSSNYIIYSLDGVDQVYASDSDYTLKEGVFTLSQRFGRGGILKISDPTVVFDEAGTTAFSESTMITFFRENSGKRNASANGATDNSNGFVDYNDAATSTTPIVLVADTWTDVPNDTLGAYTNTAYLPEGMTTLMDGSTGYLDFSELTLGSDMHIRIDYTVTPNTNNALVESRYTLGNGGGIYSLPINSKRLDSGSGIPYAADKGSFYIYMGDTNTLQGVGKLQVKLTTGGTLMNSGVAIKIYKK